MNFEELVADVSSCVLAVKEAQAKLRHAEDVLGDAIGYEGEFLVGMTKLITVYDERRKAWHVGLEEMQSPLSRKEVENVL